MSENLNEQQIVRRESLQQLIQLGIDPYPAPLFPITHSCHSFLKDFDSLSNSQQIVILAGRIMSRRIMGNASFAELQDSSGKIQLYIKRDNICLGEDKTFYNQVFKKLMDIGDIIGIHGRAFTTQTGEKSIKVESLQLLSKTIRPLPIVKEVSDESGNKILHDAFTDPELRYRQRYLDLIVNPQVKDIFIKRSRLTQSIREFLTTKGYLEVETPVLQPIYGGATARPFKTFHNTLDTTLYLRIANELYLKRLIVGGFNGVFEFSKDFRNEGMSRFHNPEFTMMELYVAYKDYYWMMDLMEEMTEKIAFDLFGTSKVLVDSVEIDFKRPWKRYTMYEVIQEFTGVAINDMDESELQNFCRELHIKIDPSSDGKGKLIDAVFSQKCESNLIQPTIIMDYPIEMSPLAKKHRTKTGLVERFEVICNCKEICNAFSELNDPLDQRKRFEEQLELGKRGDEEAMVLDEDFLRALEYGMPPTSGIGIGIDRLAMIMTNSSSIQDVIFFPQMKQERGI